MLKKPTRRLTQKELFAVAEWLKTNRDRLDKKAMSYARATALANEEMKLESPLTEYNIRGIASDLGIKWRRNKSKGSNKSSKTASATYAVLARHLRVLYALIADGLQPNSLNQIVARHRVTHLFTPAEIETLRKLNTSPEFMALLDWKLERDDPQPGENDGQA